MKIAIISIQKLREMTGAGMMNCKKALCEADGDLKEAEKILRKKGQKIARQKENRVAHEGVIGCYVHNNGKVASLIKVYCESDFVARNKEFQELAHLLAMQVLAAGALYVRPEDIPAEKIKEEKEIILGELKGKKKPRQVKEKIVAGKLKKYQEEICLLAQPFFQNPEMSVQALVQEKILKLGEKIEVGEFIKFEI
ncbi:MAG: elongation factor Ts [Patescibacteria group bacterium]|nr:elongation factor Ts [Patescibacteria group bacterium]